MYGLGPLLRVVFGCTAGAFGGRGQVRGTGSILEITDVRFILGR